MGVTWRFMTSPFTVNLNSLICHVIPWHAECISSMVRDKVVWGMNCLLGPLNVCHMGAALASSIEKPLSHEVGASPFPSFPPTLLFFLPAFNCLPPSAVILPFSTSSPSFSAVFLHLTGILCVDGVGSGRMGYLRGGVCTQEHLVRERERSSSLHTHFEHYVAAYCKLILHVCKISHLVTCHCSNVL